MIRNAKEGVLFRSESGAGQFVMTALVLRGWHKVAHGDAFTLGWNQSVLTCLVLERITEGKSDEKTPFTTDLWVPPGHEKRKVDVLWRRR